MLRYKLKELIFGIQIGLFNKPLKEVKEEKMKKYETSKEASTVIDSKTLNIIQALGLGKNLLLEKSSEMYNCPKIHKKNNIQSNASVYNVAAFR